MPLYNSLASAALTGTPTAPTAAVGTSTTQVATTAFVMTARTRACLVKKAADLTAQNIVVGQVVTWDTEVYDNEAIHDTGSNTSRLTVPAGVTYVRVTGQIAISSSTPDTLKDLQILKNGSIAFNGVPLLDGEIGASSLTLQATSGILPVVAGDYFEVKIFEESDTSVTIVAQSSWFFMEIIA